MIGNNDLSYINDDNNKSIKKIGTNNTDKINRKVTPDSYKNQVNTTGTLYWNNDPATLRDYASNTIVKTFVDTKARDISKQDWSIIKNDEEEDKEAMEFLRYAHPQKSFQDLIESTVRNMDILGNAFWVLHEYKNDDEIAEIIDPDPATIFISKDDNGFIDKYIHNPVNGGVIELEPENVIHFKVKSNTNTTYSDSFVSDSMSIIEILDEIQRKESLNLKKSAQSGLITQTETHPTDPMDSEEWNELVDYITNKNQGKTHQLSVAKGDFDFTKFEGKYKDLKLQDRYKMFIQVLGAQFGVNPSYVGFDFENTNRATDESQRQSYKERGVRTIMSNIKSKINHKLIPKITDKSSKFTWNIKQQDEIDEVNYYEKLGDAIKTLDEAGVKTELNDDDKIEIIGFKSDIENNESEDNELEELDDKIDKSQKNKNLTDREKELLDNIPYNNIKNGLEWIDNSFNDRTDAIKFTRNMMNGSLSNSTYYNWIDKYDI